MDARPSRAEAFGHPGVAPHWTSSSKDGVGTSLSKASLVWFTLSKGIVTEVYYPTIDHPQIRDLELLITDGRTFFHEEKRDLDHELTYFDRATQGYRVTGRDPEGRYRLVKEILTGDEQPCLLMRVELEGQASFLDTLQLHTILCPRLNVSGWGNSGWQSTVLGRKLLMAAKGNYYLALGADVGFTKVSVGYVGVSDGWTDIHQHLKMEYEFERAPDGHIALTAELDLSKTRQFTLGLAFGQSEHEAMTHLVQSLSIPFADHRRVFIDRWRGVQPNESGLLEEVSGDQGHLVRVSHRLLLAHEDKSYIGALIASASIPWGENRDDDDIGGYHMVWTRDLVHSADALLALGDTHTPQRTLVYLACSQQADGGFAQNLWVNGRAYKQGIQLDETALPIVLAWQLWKAGALRDFDPYRMVLAAASFLIIHGPATEEDRWERNSGFSPSSLAVMVAALTCAADFARARGDSAKAGFLHDQADFLESHIERWVTTNRGTLVEGINRHYIRILPTVPGQPIIEENPDNAEISLGNQRPGQRSVFAAREIVGGDFINLVKYGVRAAGSALMEDSIRVVDRVLKVDLAPGPCWYRYNHDGYGERPDGGPYDKWGVGRLWPLLTGERGHYELAAGRDPRPYIRAIERFATSSGLIPEQVWDADDIPEHGLYRGMPTGSANPLLWAHSEYIRLLRSVRDGRVFDMVPCVADRYLRGNGRKDLEIWKHLRPIRRVCPGTTVRVQATEEFRLRWTNDEWRTANDTSAVDSGLRLFYVDVKVLEAQRAPIRLTFYWTKSRKWEGKDFEIGVE